MNHSAASPPTTNTLPFEPGSGLRSPLSLAALITWLSVGSPVWLSLYARAQPLGASELAGLAAQALLLALFVLRAIGDHQSPTPLRKTLLMLGQLICALAACAAFDEGAQPVLLVIVASQAAMLLSRPQLLLFLLLLNAALAAILLAHNPEAPLLRVLAALGAYIGFQLFAVLIASYAQAAGQARDEALRLNAELNATRELLAEGARADERLRLSRELHDVAGHKLTALKLQLGLFERRAPPELKPPLSALHGLADELLTDVRAVASALRHHEGIDLHAALSALARAFPQPQVRLLLDERARAPDIARAEALLRVAQEALANAARHAGARTVTLRLREDSGGLSLEVQDDGRGLAGAAEGNGLTGMRERLAALGGSLSLETAEGGGLRLTATLPSASGRAP